MRSQSFPCPIILSKPVPKYKLPLASFAFGANQSKSCFWKAVFFRKYRDYCRFQYQVCPSAIAILINHRFPDWSSTMLKFRWQYPSSLHSLHFSEIFIKMDQFIIKTGPMSFILFVVHAWKHIPYESRIWESSSMLHFYFKIELGMVTYSFEK